MVETALLRSVLTGMAVGLAEIPIAHHQRPATWILGIGFNIVFALVLWLPAFLLIAAASRNPTARAFWQRLEQPGATRAGAVATIAVIGTLLVLFAVGANETLLRSLQTFHNNAKVSLVIALAAIAAEGLVLIVAFMWAVPYAARRAAQSERLARTLRGWPIALTAYVLGVLILLAAVRVIASFLAPSDPTLGYVGVASLASAVASAMVVRDRIRVNPAVRAMAFLAVAVIGLALYVAALVPQARAELAWNNTPSRAILQQLYALADRDGDGIPGALIGADCNDDDPAISPLARDIPGDGVDQNCSGADAVPEPARGGHPASRSRQSLDVLLITIDTLRADHVGSYGAVHPTTPLLDAFARKATRFAHAYSPSPLTRRALPALLYGRYATTLPFDNKNDAPTLRRNRLPSLPTLFAAAGYQTRVVMSVPGILEASWLDGFAATQTVGNSNSIDNATDVTNAALAAYATAASCGQQSFTWVHYFDPHGPYLRPAGAPDFGDRDEDRYDSEIASLDTQIGRLLRELDASGQLAHTIVVIASDHGEGFGEHGYYFHGRSLYDDQIRVPLLIAVPGGAGRVIDAPVSLVDIAPTLLDLVGMSVPSGMNGRSLADAVEHDVSPHGAVLSELIRDHSWVSRDMVAVIDASGKLIWNIDDDSYEQTSLDRDTPATGQDFGRLRDLLRARLDSELSTVPGEDESRASGRIEATK
ncbi:MAG: sulfatase-like hydrolase/transferase [Deltaproteobacteria bacterium]|nr:sulfatase-like hydrolase/transferase [Deltaproteobacteria bacterium]